MSLAYQVLDFLSQEHGYMGSTTDVRYERQAVTMRGRSGEDTSSCATMEEKHDCKCVPGSASNSCRYLCSILLCSKPALRYGQRHTLNAYSCMMVTTRPSLPQNPSSSPRGTRKSYVMGRDHYDPTNLRYVTTGPPTA
jgi:hypothetical protein